jgi:hypothetical protein
MTEGAKRGQHRDPFASSSPTVLSRFFGLLRVTEGAAVVELRGRGDSLSLLGLRRGDCRWSQFTIPTALIDIPSVLFAIAMIPVARSFLDLRKTAI